MPLFLILSHRRTYLLENKLMVDESMGSNQSMDMTGYFQLQADSSLHPYRLNIRGIADTGKDIFF